MHIILIIDYSQGSVNDRNIISPGSNIFSLHIFFNIVNKKQAETDPYLICLLPVFITSFLGQITLTFFYFHRLFKTGFLRE